jgi:hypothetical protein
MVSTRWGCIAGCVSVALAQVSPRNAKPASVIAIATSENFPGPRPGLARARCKNRRRLTGSEAQVARHSSTRAEIPRTPTGTIPTKAIVGRWAEASHEKNTASPHFYSYRNASMASTRLARYAGIYPAMQATAVRPIVATTSVAGSDAVMP